MAEQSTFNKFFYPSDQENPWYENFENAYRSIDEIMFMSRIQNNLFVANSGTFSLSGNLFVWTEDFIVPIFQHGYRLNVKYGTDGITRSCDLVDGAALIIEIPFAMSSNKDINLQSVSQLTPLAIQQFVLGWRLGSNVFIRNLGTVV